MRLHAGQQPLQHGVAHCFDLRVDVLRAVLFDRLGVNSLDNLVVVGDAEEVEEPAYVGLGIGDDVFVFDEDHPVVVVEVLLEEKVVAEVPEERGGGGIGYLLVVEAADQGDILLGHLLHAPVGGLAVVEDVVELLVMLLPVPQRGVDHVHVVPEDPDRPRARMPVEDMERVLTVHDRLEDDGVGRRAVDERFDVGAASQAVGVERLFVVFVVGLDLVGLSEDVRKHRRSGALHPEDEDRERPTLFAGDGEVDSFRQLVEPFLLGQHLSLPLLAMKSQTSA